MSKAFFNVCGAWALLGARPIALAGNPQRQQQNLFLFSLSDDVDDEGGY